MISVHRRYVLSLGVALALLGGLILLLTSSRPSTHGRHDPEPLTSGPGIRFMEQTAEARIDYSGGSFGAAWGDANGDGYPDLWASGHSPMRLLVNQRDGTFKDETRDRIGAPQYSDRHNAAWADYDNDGDDDLLQLAGADRGQGEDANRLFVNADGHLQDQAKALGLDYPKARSRAAVWLDANNDGLLDAVITAARRPEAPPALFTREGVGFVGTPLSFIEESELAQLARFDPKGGLQLLSGLPFQLLVNEVKGGAFPPVGGALGLKPSDGQDVTDTLVGDFDNDLAPDLVLVRGKIAASYEQTGPRELSARLQSYQGLPQTLRFDGAGTIRVVPFPRAKQWWGQGKIFIGRDGQPPADFPIVLSREDPGTVGLADGAKGLFIGYDPAPGAWLIQIRDPDWNSVNLQVQADGDLEGVQAEGFSPRTAPLTQPLFWNQGAGFGAPDLEALARNNCFAGAAGDFDNDGDLDLYLVCSGYLRNTENLLFENLGNRRFALVDQTGGAGGALVGVGDSVAVADYNLDGFLDLFVRNGRELAPFANGPDQIFKNQGNANHWIQFDLEGSRSNRNGIGANIVLTCADHPQVRLVDNGVHGYVQDFRRVHFGLGDCKRVDTLNVQWPSGERTYYSDLAADQVLILDESGGVRPRFPAGKG